MTNETNNTTYHGLEYPAVGYNGSEPVYGVLLNQLFESIDDRLVKAGHTDDQPNASGSGKFWYGTNDNVLYYDSGTWETIAGNATHIIEDTKSNRPSASGTNGWFYATDENTLYYDGGSWIAVTGQSGTLITDEITDFSTSGFSLAHTNTEVNSGNIHLTSSVNITSTVTMNISWQSKSQGKYVGIQFNPNNDLTEINAITAPYTSASPVYLRDSSGTDLESRSNSGGGTTLTFDNNGNGFTAGTDYRLVATGNVGRSFDGGYPYTSTDVDITDGVKDGSVENNNSVIETIEAKKLQGQTSGDCIIAYDSVPSDLSRWDVIRYKKNIEANGPTVKVNILDSNDNVLFSDVDRNTQLSTLSPSENYKVQVEIERSDLKNDPQFTYVGRQYVGN